MKAEGRAIDLIEFAVLFIDGIVAGVWRQLCEPSAGRKRPQVRFQLRVPGTEFFSILLSRILLEELSEISRYAAAIEPDYHHAWRRTLSAEPLLLPKLFIGVEAQFGRSARNYDPWKSSFHVPLLLSARREGIAMRYLVLLGDYRGSAEFRFYRVGRERPDSHRYYPPLENELSKDHLNYLSDYLFGYLLGFGESVARRAPSFYRVVGSERVVYGKRNGDLFERSFEREEPFRQLIDTLDRELAELNCVTDLEEILLTLEGIEGGALHG